MPLLDYPLTWTAPPRGRVLVLAPHPDDESIGCGGVLALHVAQGDPVSLAIATDGAAGDPEGRFAAGDYVALRRDEARAAARTLGSAAPEFWDLPDGGLTRLLATRPSPLVDAVRSAIDRVRPDLLYFPSETEMHPDHHALAAATREALATVRSRPLALAYEVWVPVHPTHVIDVSSVFDVKRRALACYASQLAYNDYPHAVAGLNAARSIFLPGARYVEAFAAT